MPFPKDHKYTAEEFFSLIPENDSQQHELIDGEIVALSAPSIIHQRLSMRLSVHIGGYILSKKGKCEPFAAPTDVVIDGANVVQPDVFVICDPSKYDDKRCYGAPDWCIEVLSTNRSNDLIDKLILYQKHGVREYWIVDPENEKVLVYFFERSELLSIYTFDSDIPVGIYDGKLSIRINDMI